jgi:TRAP-type mannitol/chloroaromatic compound transport system substrate-binding protein
MEKVVESRRSFLKRGAMVAGAAAGTLAAPAIGTAQSPQVLRMQSSWGASEIFQEMARDYCDLVEQMAGGRVRIELLPAGSVVGAFQVMDAVNDGVIDAVHQVPVYWYAKHKGASLFGTGPVFGGDAANLLSWVHSGGGKAFYEELTQQILGLNVVGFFGMPMPQQPFGWFKNPVTSAADVNGLKYRTVGLAADLCAAMGMSVVQLPGGEIVPAMERGVIDAFEFNNPTSDRRFGAQDVAKNYMLGSFHQASEFFEINYNKDIYDEMPDDLKAIVEHAAAASATLNYAKALDNYSRDLAGLVAENGVTVIRTPADVLETQIAAWDTLIEQLSADDFINRALASQKEWVERTVYYQIMNQADLSLAYNHYFPGKLPA